MSAETQGAETRIAEIRERVEAATPGAWRWSVPDSEVTSFSVGRIIWGACDEDGEGSIGQWIADVSDADTQNAAFIAHAREDVPWLLDRLDEARRERDEARRALEVAEHDLRYVIAALSPSELVRLGRLLQEEVAAFAARPAETPEGR